MLEVGMGGRLDATNVVEPRVSVITDISLDHQKFLGDTVAEIAARKGGNHTTRRRGGDATPAAAGQRRDRQHDSGAGSAGGECGAVCAAGESGEPRISGGQCGQDTGFALSAAGDGGADYGRNSAAGTSSAEKCCSGDRRGGRTGPAGISGDGGLDRAGHSRNALAGAIPGHARDRRRPRICLRCGAQSGGSMGFAFHSFGGLSGSAADVYFWRDAGQGHRRDGGNSVSAGGAGDRDSRRQSALGQSGRDSRSCVADFDRD